MAASEPNGPGEQKVQESHVAPSSLSPKGVSANGTKRHVHRGIVIQLTGTEGEWDSLDDSELIFSLDEDYPTISLTKEQQLSANDDLLLHAPPCHVPLSSSTPNSLGNCSGTSFLSPGPSSPTHRPFSSLVKSLSSELEFKEGATLRPKPLLNLVKSISTEISRSDPEISQSKSDSRLNLHLWKQLTQPKNRSDGDSRTAPPSPSALSPSGEGGKGSFFKMELEDTKRKLSEAVHEHSFSSMFQKIMREESGGSPKHSRKKQAVLLRSMAQDGSTDSSLMESPGNNAKRAEEIPQVFEWPPFKHHKRTCPVYQNRLHQREEELEVFAEDDLVQISITEKEKPPSTLHIPDEPPIITAPLPHMSLFCIGVLSYGYLILPLGSYFSGMAIGVALGFLIGLMLIRLSTTRSNSADPKHRKSHNILGEAILSSATVRTESDILKGWMNEVYDYDPQTYHPSQSHSVFATLEGSCLRLDSPRNNISRRATYGERLPDMAFVKTRCFELANCKVFLLPSVLAQKRQWNPKYPLCVQLYEKKAGSDEDLSAEQPQTQSTSTLYLFGRTGREKEEWYRHFLLASDEAERAVDRCVGRSGDVPAALPAADASSRPFSRVGSEEDPLAPPVPPQAPAPRSSHGSTRGQTALDYHSYMSQLLSTAERTPPCSPGAGSTATSPTSLAGHCTCNAAEDSGKSHTAWVNALIGRIFWDFLQEKYYADMVSNKIQKKLSTIRLPYFMNELTVTEMDLGTSMPLVTATSKAEINPRGLWLELQLDYNGGLQMTLETKFNLTKLGKEDGQEVECRADAKTSRPVLSVLADSDEESSSAGSSDEEELLLSEPQGPVGDKGPSMTTNEGAGGGKTGRKILRFVDKIAKSKYFQKAAENEFIKKKFEEMSNTPLLLTVEVQELSGALVVNIPPPPTDRIWYSFCSPPKLDLRVRPKLGEREVTFCHVTEWIEKKLQEEFQKVFVFPNMDDICVPLMQCGLEQPRSCESNQRIPEETWGAQSEK